MLILNLLNPQFATFEIPRTTAMSLIITRYLRFEFLSSVECTGVTFKAELVEHEYSVKDKNRSGDSDLLSL